MGLVPPARQLGERILRQCSKPLSTACEARSRLFPHVQASELGKNGSLLEIVEQQQGSAVRRHAAGAAGPVNILISAKGRADLNHGMHVEIDATSSQISGEKHTANGWSTFREERNAGATLVAREIPVQGVQAWDLTAVLKQGVNELQPPHRGKDRQHPPRLAGRVVQLLAQDRKEDGQEVFGLVADQDLIHWRSHLELPIRRRSVRIAATCCFRRHGRSCRHLVGGSRGQVLGLQTRAQGPGGEAPHGLAEGRRAEHSARSWSARQATVDVVRLVEELRVQQPIRLVQNDQLHGAQGTHKVGRVLQMLRETSGSSEQHVRGVGPKTSDVFAHGEAARDEGGPDRGARALQERVGNARQLQHELPGRREHEHGNARGQRGGGVTLQEVLHSRHQKGHRLAGARVRSQQQVRARRLEAASDRRLRREKPVQGSRLDLSQSCPCAKRALNASQKARIQL
mmetsp:Transcript_46169/g.148249  ORF Transcript_46169/g.148249 Transcript_46169/m.148249 type:complete len:457 (+) Transcript_46169:400-1770(+)